MDDLAEMEFGGVTRWGRHKSSSCIGDGRRRLDE